VPVPLTIEARAKGGRNSTANLTPEELTERGRAIVRARWKGTTRRERSENARARWARVKAARLKVAA